ncbi:hypothetical protein OG266_21995 [Streptomyces sp. NBC_00554]|uniref:hypothetical protein n=1 Tax=Streptomyces sp. NBC_00554 TaxID=2903661 RepID=UPI00352CD7F2|nr:hypothetical protein OG266_21995 [Streptomyces sp. NBC_00554]
MRTRTRIATTCAAAAVVTIAFTGQASAAETASCSTTGARGSMGATYPTGDQWPYKEFKIALSVTDTSADGHHVRVRFLSKAVGTSATTTWAWHSLTSGSGETLTLSTTAQTSWGIEATGVEVARFEGSTKLNSCTDWS